MSYHPQTNGQTEQVNQVIEQYLRMYCNYEQDDWSSLIHMAAFVYNNTVHASIGISPFFACYGWNPKSHLEIPGKLWVNDPKLAKYFTDNTERIKYLQDHIRQAQSRAVNQYNCKWKDIEFKVGDLCHGPGCSRSRRVMGSYGRSTGIEDLVDTSREHGRSAVSMETMDSYGFTCKGALSPYARRTRHSHEEDQAQRAGAAMRRTKLRWLPLRGSRDRNSVEGVDTGHEEEEQCRRSRHRS
ncbi:hypothetical protein NDA17_002086 [Ustilago hordei]|nr:hypothetical protein NDA17_002086 [Ustilago hordei]